ncbi:MAG: phage tail assembly chaperone [Pseudomonadota bacterium]
MLPWSAMMRASLSAGMSIQSFWEMSLVEWRWLAAGRGDDALGEDQLSALMREFPDAGGFNG